MFTLPRSPTVPVLQEMRQSTPPQRRTDVEQFSPSFHVRERIDVQIRTYIWVPGIVTKMGYSERAASLLYEIRYVAADGSRRCESFYPRDVRPPE
ncbi:hypothetical protein LXA43DRAFT_1146695 [Ganoderma leucocontextum]|nr:hypothetical protein LXA43DRAFT_1146695 [Ganoderma leucocontextum]